MKRLASFLAVMALSSQLINYPSDDTDRQYEASVSVSEALSAADIESALSLTEGTLKGITVTALPPFENGRLVCEGIAVEAFDYLPRESLDWLVFESFSEDAAAAFSVLPDTGKTTQECMLALGNADESQTIIMRADILAWKQVESKYFSQPDEGF